MNRINKIKTTLLHPEYPVNPVKSFFEFRDYIMLVYRIIL